jgi:isopentenyl-diphosphate delta-isomerase
MSKKQTEIRKEDHIDLCLTDKVDFQSNTNGFEKYEFEHFAITEVVIDKIDLTTQFLKKKIDYPFLISCMTGGTSRAKDINKMLAIAANELNIPLGIGSQRIALEGKKQYSTYKVVRDNAKEIPILGNVGAAQIVKSKNPVDDIKFLIDIADANAMVVHLNPLQELLQSEGEPDFKGLLSALEKICSQISVPIIAKEVGAGISKKAAKKLLNVGVQGIDVAGAGGTSWAAVELLRSNKKDDYFKEWGLPTSYCVRTVNELKKNHKFVLISSGGIASGIDIAKSIAIGADITASAGVILKEIDSNGVEGVVKLILSWFDTVKKIMFLTGCENISMLNKLGLKRKEELY